MRFLSLEKETFGMDISDLSLKIAKLKEKGGKHIFSSFGFQKIKEGVIEEGIIKDEEKLSLFVKKALENVRGEKIKTKYVVCCLPEEKSFLQILSLPRMTDEELESAVPFEIEDHIPLGLNEVYLDWERIPLASPHSQTQEVLVLACPREIVDFYLKVLKRANLEPVAFEVESLALARALIPKSERDSSFLIVDIGETRTTFAIYSRGSLRFTSTVLISGRLFTELISKNLSLSFPEAERIKRKFGLKEVIELKFEATEKVFKTKRGKIFEALIPILIDLVQQIEKIIAFFETHETGKIESEKIRKILICGGGANLKGLREFLNYKLKIPVEFGNPFSNLTFSTPPPLSFEKILSFSTAIGLAMRKQ
jgi:type IV pilus assembly protein PilM